jgi:hypothetical protein
MDEDENERGNDDQQQLLYSFSGAQGQPPDAATLTRIARSSTGLT